jgi:hypothetical protein
MSETRPGEVDLEQALNAKDLRLVARIRRRAWVAAYETTTSGDDGEMVVAMHELDGIILDEIVDELET